MADSLFLKGVKDIQNHTGSEMMLAIPSRGGNTHPIRRWYADGNPAAYVNCTVFDVNAAGTPVKLVVESGASTELQIEHDGAGNFSFPKHREVRKAAKFSADFSTVLETYKFSTVPGGKVGTNSGSFDPSSGTISLDLPTFTVGQSSNVELKSTATTRAAVCDSWCLSAKGYTSTWVITGSASWGYINPCMVWINCSGGNIGVYSCLYDPNGVLVSCEGSQTADTPTTPSPLTGKASQVDWSTLPSETVPWADGPVVALTGQTIEEFKPYVLDNLSGTAGTGFTVMFLNLIVHDGELFVKSSDIIVTNTGQDYQVGDVVGFSDDVPIAGITAID